MPYKDPDKQREYKRTWARRNYCKKNNIKCDELGKYKVIPPKPIPSENIPDHIFETAYYGIYVTHYGDAYRLPLDKGERMPVNEWGLIYLKPALRGHKKYKEKQYYCINITLRDEEGNVIKQIKKSNHQLVAETFIPNPNNHTEVLHSDDNCKNNYYKNLKWGTHKENMQSNCLPEGTIREHQRYTSPKNGYKRNPTKYIKKDGKWVLIPCNRPVWNKGLKGSSWNTLPDGTVRTRKVNGKDAIFIKQNGEWVYQKKIK